MRLERYTLAESVAPISACSWENPRPDLSQIPPCQPHGLQRGSRERRVGPQPGISLPCGQAPSFPNLQRASFSSCTSQPHLMFGRWWDSLSCGSCHVHERNSLARLCASTMAVTADGYGRNCEKRISEYMDTSSWNCQRGFNPIQVHICSTLL